MAEVGPTNPLLQWILPSAAVFLLALVLAFFVLRASPARPANRLLSAILLAEGALTLTAGLVAYRLWPADSSFFAVMGPTILALLYLGTVLYVGLLSTLATPLVRWARGGRWALLALPLGAVWAYDTFGPAYTQAPLYAGGLLAGVYVFAVVAALDAVRRAAPGSPARAQAKAFATAFVLRDLLMLAFLGLVMIGTPDVNEMPTWKLALLYATNPLAVVQVVYLPLLAYGALRTRLFDVDLRIKRGVSAATVTAIFVSAFFVASEVTQQFVGERAGPYVGIVAAGALLLAIQPVQRLAHRAADAAMPGVTGSAEYVAARKLHVYRAAVEGAYEDGTLGAKERGMLTRLAAELELDPREMVAVEDEVRSSLKPRAR